MAHGILTPCNVASASRIVTVNSPSGSTLQCDTWLWDDMPLNSPMSFCTVSEILSKSNHHQQKKMTSYRFSRWRISAILDFRGPIISFLKSPCATSYRSSIDTIALNCLVFEKIAFFLHFDDRQTDKQTNRWAAPMHEAALAVASGGLTTEFEKAPAQL